MKTLTKLGLATALAVMIAAPSAFAQDTGSGGSGQDGMMQGEGMKGQDGMMGMMQMMQACTEMMQAMTTHHPSEAPATDEKEG